MTTHTMLALITLMAVIHASSGQTQPIATNADCICKVTDPVCICELRIEHKLTMILEKERKLVYPDNGVLRMRGTISNNSALNSEQTSRVITADGQISRLVIAINGKFPGPRIEAFVNQKMKVRVINTLHTDSVTVHFHGLHQKGSPWMDGVAFISQCPILPGQTFVHEFNAYPSGTSMYHAHIGDQRSMGLYGAVVIHPLQVRPLGFQIVITLQDWNHLMDAETAYHRMITQQFDFQTDEVINTTYSVDRGMFSRFEFQSGLVNGKGRYWYNTTTNNGSPLERFKISSGKSYRFRIIGAMTLYPMRVYLEGQRFSILGSDCFDLDDIPVQSFIIHPGERYDFLWQAPSESTRKEILFVAETIESPRSLNFAKYHAAEAILELVEVDKPFIPNPPKAKKENCTRYSPCVIFNCPFEYYPDTDYRNCTTYNEITNQDPKRYPESILGLSVDEEYFFNFAFPGPPGKTEGSVNGRQFLPPTVSMLTQPDEVTTQCNESICRRDGICECTYTQKIPSNKIIQMVFLNLGNGSGWSHPVHLHGHSFYVMKMGFGTYNKTTGVLISQTSDLNCTDDKNFCSTAAWTDPSWGKGNVSFMNIDPPEKDTIIVPTGGYVVVRFVSDNPGMWFLHCHIDLHNTNGMGMVIDEGEFKPTPPLGFPTCRSFRNDNPNPSSASGLLDGGIIGFVLILLAHCQVII